MKKFLLLFVGKELKLEEMGADTEAYMKEWEEWMSDMMEKDILESGMPLEWGGKIVMKDSISEYQPEEIDIGGYMIINAISIDEAARIARQTPNVALGGEVIVRPCLDMRT